MYNSVRNIDGNLKHKRDLTRFNKSAIQGAHQMAVDKEAYRESTHTILGVTSPYSMCNLP